MPKQKNSFLKFLPVIVTAVLAAVVALIVLTGRTRQKQAALARRAIAERLAAERGTVVERDAGPDASETISEITDTILLTVKSKEMPGKQPATLLRYYHASAPKVLVSGSWDGWQEKVALVRDGKEWVFDIRPLQMSQGYHEFKFLPDGEWEAGKNRILYVGDDGYVERPLTLILSARMQSTSRIHAVLARELTKTEEVTVRLSPEVPLASVSWGKARPDRNRLGFSASGNLVTFYMDEALYGVNLAKNAKISVAGSFNGWKQDSAGEWMLQDEDNDNLWVGTFAIDLGREKPEFRFRKSDGTWLVVPEGLPNAVTDKDGNRNLRLDPKLSESPVLDIETETPLDLTVSYLLLIDGVGERSAVAAVAPGDILDDLTSREPMGPVKEAWRDATTFQLFAPRASKVTLGIFDSPHLVVGGSPATPRESKKMRRLGDGVAWSLTLNGAGPGDYYAYRIEGPRGRGEGFDSNVWVGDPYARAAAYAHNASILIDPTATNEWFGGWTDADYKAPAWQDAVIYEAHVRDLTMDPSSGVPEGLRGTFAGLSASVGTGTGLDHLKALGVNMIELLPMAEYGNGTNTYDWGYGPVYYFAPESSFGQDPLKGSQYYEMKALVNRLHEQGFGVILDVVYSHVGHPNPFDKIDRPYHFRTGAGFTLQNYSGGGNDLRTEAPMLRRLIVENVLYWMNEFHVDGFRFDLAELIDMDTLMEIRDKARKLNPNILLISEPWSFRGDHKHKLTGTGWAAWNNEFRDTVKDFVLGKGDREALKKVIVGTVDTWADTPMQSVNYLESHDDRCLADNLTAAADHDARNLEEVDGVRNRMAATILFTSLGIPMLAEGQEFLRSKHGIHNTFDKGDAVNALRWGDRDRPIASETMAYYKGLIKLRQSWPGASFRQKDTVPYAYYDWIEPEDPRALGYLVNGEAQADGLAFLVLINASDAAVRFPVRFPPGPWRLIGDGKRILPGGIKELDMSKTVDGMAKIKVAPMSTYLFVRPGARK